MRKRLRPGKKQPSSIGKAADAATGEPAHRVVATKLPTIDVDRLARLAELRELDILSREEYEEQKAGILRADV